MIPTDTRSTVPLYRWREIVDAGFLELVRYGIRSADDPVIKDSLRVVDAVLNVETPHGPAWRRYNHGGYGQRDDGRSYVGWGTGRPWPLLTGERGHYEIAADRDHLPYLRALANFSKDIGLMPEQIWDGARADLEMSSFWWSDRCSNAVTLVEFRLRQAASLCRRQEAVRLSRAGIRPLRQTKQ